MLFLINTIATKLIRINNNFTIDNKLYYDEIRGICELIKFDVCKHIIKYKCAENYGNIRNLYNEINNLTSIVKDYNNVSKLTNMLYKTSLIYKVKYNKTSELFKLPIELIDFILYEYYCLMIEFD